MDPHTAGDALSAEYIVEIFGGLVTIDPDLNIVLDLGESVEVSADSPVYTLRRRSDGAFKRAERGPGDGRRCRGGRGCRASSR